MEPLADDFRQRRFNWSMMEKIGTRLVGLVARQADDS